MSEEFVTWLQEELDRRGWSARQLGRRAGISNTSINNVLSRKTGPSWDFCAAIADPLQMPLLSIFRLAGLMRSTRERSEDITFEELVEIMEKLPPKKRKEILRYAKYLWRYGDEE